jgi:hypothetical protein
LLSLEAPIVAVAWTLGLARLHHVLLMPGVLLGLGLCVWIVYVLDRVLDGFSTQVEPMDIRHEFHRRWWKLLLVALACGAAVTTWLALNVVPAALMWECLGLGVLMLLYLAVYASGGSRWYHHLMIPASSLGALVVVHSMPLPPGFQLMVTLLILGVLCLVFFRRLRMLVTTPLAKDVVGGMLFALGCTAWTRFVHAGGDLQSSAVELFLPACLFISNLTGISTRAAQGRWLSMGFGLVSGVCALAASGRMASSLGVLAQACGIGLILLLVLDWKRKPLSPEAYRVWADLAVLVPVVYLWIRA